MKQMLQHLLLPCYTGVCMKKEVRKVSELEKMERNMAVMAARQDFIDAALSMGWQLALTILIPVFIGVQIDKKFDSSPSYTLTALFLAIGLGGYVVAQAIKKVSAKQESRRVKKS